MVTVYIWDNGRGTGHSSLMMEGNNYVSFHPDTKDNIFKIAVNSYRPKADQTLTDDEIVNKDLQIFREPKHKIELSEPHEDLMAQRWEDIKTDGTNYQFWSSNCSNVVGNLLMVGLGQKVLSCIDPRSIVSEIGSSITSFYKRDYEPIDGRYTEAAIRLLDIYVMSMLRYRSAKASAAVRTFAVATAETAATTAYAAIHGIVWTPGKVLHLAEHIKKMQPAIRKAAQGR